MIIGIDAHKRSESVCITDDDGNIMEEYSMKNDDEEWIKFIQLYPSSARIAVETSGSGKPIARMLRDAGFELHLANPKQLKMIYQSRKKTDRNDARALAKLLRLNELPESYLPTKEIDDIRSLVRYRKSLSDDITEIKNRVHSILTRNRVHIEASDIFGKRALKIMEGFVEKLQFSDALILSDLIERFRETVARREKLQGRMASIALNIEEIKLLMTIPGIDYYSALSIYSEIGDIRRFPDKDHFASYTGLVPSVDQSGEHEYYGHITKEGPSILRYVLVNAAHSLLKVSPSFKSRYLKLRGRIGEKRAVVAIARRLAVLIYRMLTNNEEYDEGRSKTLYLRKMKNMEYRSSTTEKFNTEVLRRLIMDKEMISASTELLS